MSTQTPAVPFFARHSEARPFVVRTGVLAGARERARKR